MKLSRSTLHIKGIFTLILISSITILASLNINRVLGTEAVMRIVNPLTGDGKFIFNATEGINYTGTDFTVQFYISGISDMVAWQIAISWNNSIIQYNQTKNPLSWVFPHGNVFQQAEDEGYEIIKTCNFIEVETAHGPSQDPTAPGTGFLKAGATTIPFYPVNVEEREALLCQINFTIVAMPQPGEILQTNINLEKILDPLNPSLDSFVMHTDLTKTEINAESAVVKIIAGEEEIIRDIAITSVKLSKQKLFVGENVTITIYFKNEGNDQEKFNFTIECEKDDGSFKLTLFKYYKLLNPGQEDYYKYVWVIPANMSTGKYILRFSVDPLEGEEDLTDNELQLTINIEKKLSSFEYVLWLLSLWLTTPLGIFLIVYLASIVGFFSIMTVIRKIKAKMVRKV